MKIEVNLNLDVDPDANFLGCDEQAVLEVLMDTIKTAFYEIDDIKLTYIELEKT
jgi:hypothetical protein|tara:strand:- start:4486 stop:4647 length:162 start_codon:yes stop_codon:yes gene_type:complete